MQDESPGATPARTPTSWAIKIPQGLGTLLFRQLIDEMEPGLYMILSGYTFYVAIPLSNAKNTLECRRLLGGTVSPIPLPSFLIIALVPALYAQKDRQAVLMVRDRGPCGDPTYQ